MHVNTAVNPFDWMDAAAEGLLFAHSQPLWTRWMLQQRDLLFACSQPFGLDGCCNRWTCCLHVVSALD